MHPLIRWFAVPVLLLSVALGTSLAWLVRPRVAPPKVSGSSWRLDCGHWAVIRAAELLGTSVSPSKSRQLLPPNEAGHHLRQIAQALEELGFEVEGRQETLACLAREPSLRIAHLRAPDHFIVIPQTAAETILYFDDHGRAHRITARQLERRWSGKTLLVRYPAQKNHTNTPPGPRIQFDTLFLDQGQMTPAAARAGVQYVYRFRNEGSEPLQLQRVSSNCRCLAAEYPKLPIAAGESGEISLTFTATGERPDFLHEIWVESNCAHHPGLVLRAGGSIDLALLVSPRTLRLGDIPVGGKPVRLLVLRYSGTDTYAVTEVRAEGFEPTLRWRELSQPEAAPHLWPGATERMPVGHQLIFLEVAFDVSTATSNALEGELVISGSHPIHDEVRVPVRGRVVALANAYPYVAYFTPTGTDDEVQAVVRLAAAASETNLEVCGVELGGRTIDWSCKNLEGAPTQCELRMFGPRSMFADTQGEPLRLQLRVGTELLELELPFLMKSHGQRL